jgi:hypothetical protein
LNILLLLLAVVVVFTLVVAAQGVLDQRLDLLLLLEAL